MWKEFYDRYVKDVFPSLRPSQVDILSQIRDDARLVVISAPTGVGKSLIGIIRGVAESGVRPSQDPGRPGAPHVYVVTPTKGLQDQYRETLNRIYMHRNWSYMVLKGRQNYSCPLLGKGKTAADCPVLNAWSRGRRYCPYKPRRVDDISKVDVDDYVVTADGSYLVPPGDRWCPYWLDKYEALRSNFVVFNYHYYLQELFYVGDFPASDVVVFDEVHTVFNVLDSILSLRIYPSLLNRWGVEVDGFYSSPILYVNALRSAMNNRIYEVEERLNSLASEDELDSEERSYFYHYMRLFNEMYESFIKLSFFLQYTNYFYIRTKLREGGVDLFMRPYPVFFAYVLNRTLFPRYQNDTNFSSLVIAMSATPGTKGFWSRLAYLASLLPQEVEYIDYQQSPFPVNNRLIFIPSDAPMVTERVLRKELGSLYDYADRLEMFTPEKIFSSPTVRAQVFLIQRLYNMFGRVLVHTWNNRLAYLVSMGLKLLGVPVLFPRERPTEQIQEWALGDEESVLVTAAAKEGVDLAYERARVQVILKLPIPNQRDPYVSMLRTRFREFYDYQIASALVQQAGRVVRARDDWGYTIVYDSRVKNFVFSKPSYFPRYFREALVTRYNTEQVLDYLAEDYLTRRVKVQSR